MRRFVIGDIHGCGKALGSLIEAIEPTRNDELIFLGDYVDRGPDSKDVIDQIIALQEVTNVVALRGNHEIMLMGVALRGLDPDPWLRSGGQATVTSYGGKLSKIPASHFAFFQDLRSFYETNDSIFVHANYHHNRDMPDQEEAHTYWTHLTIPPPRHKSGKRVFVGHTPQPGGNILHLDHLVCVDTYCFGGGYLTALNVETFEMIQCNLHGHIRRTPISTLVDRFKRIGEWIGNCVATSRSGQEGPRDEERDSAQSTDQAIVSPASESARS